MVNRIRRRNKEAGRLLDAGPIRPYDRRSAKTVEKGRETNRIITVDYTVESKVGTYLHTGGRRRVGLAPPR